MSGILKWAESKLEKIDNLTAQAFNNPKDDLPTDQNKDKEIVELQQYIYKLKSDIRVIRNLSDQQIQEITDKFSAEIDTYKQENETLSKKFKKSENESRILAEQAKSSEDKLKRVQEMYDQLMASLEATNEPYSPKETITDQNEYELFMMKQQVNSLKALLFAEKMKTEDALREKTELNSLNSVQKEQLENQIQELQKQIDTLKHENSSLLKQVDHLKATEKVDTEEQNLIALSEHLQTKQRTIQNLISERATLLIQLENEKKEKLSLLESGSSKVHRQLISSLNFIKGRRYLKTFVDWLDEGLRELSDTLDEMAVARMCLLIYSIFLHILALYSLFGTGGESQNFIA